LQFCNMALEQLTGYARPELVGRLSTDRKHAGT
jgi:hypothetical protein